MPDRLSAWTLSRAEGTLPACLEECPRPPALLHGFGDASLLRPGLAVVGSRRATPYGIACAREFAGWAAEQGVVVVSGAAYGCDRAAHEAAMEAGGRTVAVLGCGADVDYPPSARLLLAAMRRGQAVVSELDWGTRPMPFTFPNRNRIIAGLAAAVLVVEAAPKSGTFSTVEHALDAGRDVLAVPGSVFSDSSRGCNSLVREGATPICETRDLKDALVHAGLIREAGDLEARQHPALPEGSPEELLARALLADPMRPEDAGRVLALPAVLVSRSLSLLETLGVVARYPDGRYGPCER